VNIKFFNRRIRREGNRNVVGIAANGEFLPFKDNIFDLVTCSEVLEHIAEPKKALKEMYRVLKPGGRLLISTPNRFAAEFWVKLFWLPRAIKRALELKNPFSPAEGKCYDSPLYEHTLRQYLQDAGFTPLKFEKKVLLVETTYYQFIPYPLVWLSIKTAELLEKRLKVLSCFGLYFLVECRK